MSGAEGALYIDPEDGEIVRVELESAWLEQWGPLTPGLTVARVVSKGPRCERVGEVVQRDLSRRVLLVDANGRVPEAISDRASLADPTPLLTEPVWQQVCLCPATSEHDPPCPRHGALGIGVTGRP